MNYLLDTNVVSISSKSHKAAPEVIAWLSSKPVDQLFISAISILEIERGILLVRRRDAMQAALLQSWFDDVVSPGFTDRILPVDEHVARSAAAFHVPNPQPYADTLIAATALVHGLTVVTQNIKHFGRLEGIRTVNPFLPA